MNYQATSSLHPHRLLVRPSNKIVATTSLLLKIIRIIAIVYSTPTETVNSTLTPVVSPSVL